MERLVLTVAIVAVVGAVAVVLRHRRHPDAPTQAHHDVPSQLDRADFPHADAEWLLVVFSSATCHTCAEVVTKARVMASPAVGFAEIEFGARRDLHERYAIDAVPMVLLADRAGVVRMSHLGRISATDLWAGVAEVREPGSRPEGGRCHRDDGADGAATE